MLSLFDEVFQDRGGDAIGNVPNHERLPVCELLSKRKREEVLTANLNVSLLSDGPCEDCCEPPVELDGNNMVGHSCQLMCDRPQPRADLHDLAGLSLPYLIDNRIEYGTVDEEALPQPLAWVYSRFL